MPLPRQTQSRVRPAVRRARRDVRSSRRSDERRPSSRVFGTVSRWGAQGSPRALSTRVTASEIRGVDSPPPTRDAVIAHCAMQLCAMPSHREIHPCIDRMADGRLMDWELWGEGGGRPVAARAGRAAIDITRRYVRQCTQGGDVCACHGARPKSTESASLGLDAHRTHLLRPRLVASSHRRPTTCSLS